MGQTGPCPSRARQAAFLEEKRNLTAQSQQCNLASSGEKHTCSDSVREFQVLKVSSIVRQMFKYKHKWFNFSFFLYTINHTTSFAGVKCYSSNLRYRDPWFYIT